MRGHRFRILFEHLGWTTVLILTWLWKIFRCIESCLRQGAINCLIAAPGSRNIGADRDIMISRLQTMPAYKRWDQSHSTFGTAIYRNPVLISHVSLGSIHLRTHVYRSDFVIGGRGKALLRRFDFGLNANSRPRQRNSCAADHRVVNRSGGL